MTQASPTQVRSWSECCGKPLKDSKTGQVIAVIVKARDEVVYLKLVALDMERSDSVLGGYLTELPMDWRVMGSEAPRMVSVLLWQLDGFSGNCPGSQKVGVKAKVEAGGGFGKPGCGPASPC